MSFAKTSLSEARAVLNNFTNDDVAIHKLNSAITMMVETYKHHGKIFSCGNGGSMCDATHFAEELTGRYRQDRPSLPAMALNDAAHITCVANDYGYDSIFSRSLEGWGNKGDILLAISTSGNSENIIQAAEMAKKKGMKIIGLTGKGGGKLKDMCDIAIVVDSQYTDRIQEIHIKCIHIFIEGIERALFPQNYKS